MNWPLCFPRRKPPQRPQRTGAARLLVRSLRSATAISCWGLKEYTFACLCVRIIFALRKATLNDLLAVIEGHYHFIHLSCLSSFKRPKACCQTAGYPWPLHPERSIQRTDRASRCLEETDSPLRGASNLRDSAWTSSKFKHNLPSHLVACKNCNCVGNIQHIASFLSINRICKASQESLNPAIQSLQGRKNLQLQYQSKLYDIVIRSIQHQTIHYNIIQC